MPDRFLDPRKRSPFARFLSYMLVPVLALAIIALAALIWAGVEELRDFKRNVAKVETVQTNSCQATNKARRESNEHLRAPLKKAVALAGGGTAKQRAARIESSQAEADKLQALAKAETDPAVKELLTLFATALGGSPQQSQAYADLAAQITTVPLLDCKTGRTITTGGT